MPHNSRRPAQIPRIKSVKVLALQDDLKIGIDNRLSNDLANLRYNIKFICFARGYSLTYAIGQLRAKGIRIRRRAFTENKNNGRVSALYLSTWAFVLDVPTWLLLSESIESDCERLGIKRR